MPKPICFRDSWFQGHASLVPGSHLVGSRGTTAFFHGHTTLGSRVTTLTAMTPVFNPVAVSVSQRRQNRECRRPEASPATALPGGRTPPVGDCAREAFRPRAGHPDTARDPTPARLRGHAGRLAGLPKRCRFATSFLCDRRSQWRSPAAASLSRTPPDTGLLRREQTAPLLIAADGTV